MPTRRKFHSSQLKGPYTVRSPNPTVYDHRREQAVATSKHGQKCHVHVCVCVFVAERMKSLQEEICEAGIITILPRL